MPHVSVAFWTVAFLNMAVIAGLVGFGVRRIRIGDVVAHRRAMLSAGVLVVGFLLSYVAKVFLLGREDLSVWSPSSVRMLHFHETCVTLMLLAGGAGATFAFKMRKTRAVTRNPEDPMATESIVRWHRRLGWTAVASALFGFISAGFVLAGMYSRQ